MSNSINNVIEIQKECIIIVNGVIIIFASVCMFINYKLKNNNWKNTSF